MKFRGFLISFAVALITSVSIYGGYTIYADEVDLNDPGLSYFDIFDLYHGQMNDLFNERLKAMVEILKEKDRSRLEIPTTINRQEDSLEQIVQKCNAGEPNVSSYCVSMEALALYGKYVERLALLKGALEPEPDSNVQTLLLETAARNEFAEKEARDAKDVLEATMSAYEEFYNAYPMHQKYQEIITALLKYKLALKDIRKEVQFFPLKFVDATSSYCK